MTTTKTHVCCIGAGYVGGPTMAMLAYKCPHAHVTVVDISQKRIDQWNSDKLPIFEPGLDEVVKAARGKNLFFSTDIEGAVKKSSIIFVSVNTPTKRFGIGAGVASNVTNLEKAARSIARYATSSKIIVEKSTVPVRTAETLQTVLDAGRAHEGIEFNVLSNPEFLAEGTAIRDLEAPGRVLIGGKETPAGRKAVQTLFDLYANWVPKERIITTNLWSSELSKLVANAFLAQRISSINSISALCEKTGADVFEVAKAVGADPRVGPRFLQASVGFGGSCFQKDILNLVYIAKSFGLPEVAEYWKQVVKINEYQKNRFAQAMVRRMFNTVTGKKIALFGFAFKKDTGDTRETAAAYVAEVLLKERANVVVYDPQVTEEDMYWELEHTVGISEETIPDLKSLITMCKDPIEAVTSAHAVAVMTEWDEFRTMDYKAVFGAMESPAFFFDGRNVVDHAELHEIGFKVHCIGKKAYAL